MCYSVNINYWHPNACQIKYYVWCGLEFQAWKRTNQRIYKLADVQNENKSEIRNWNSAKNKDRKREKMGTFCKLHKWCDICSCVHVTACVKFRLGIGIGLEIEIDKEYYSILRDDLIRISKLYFFILFYCWNFPKWCSILLTAMKCRVWVWDN